MKLRNLHYVMLVAAALAVSTHAGALPTSDFGEATPLEAQPHMKAALATLKVAKGQLQKATPDKGGHRVAAIALVNDAIGEVEKGIAYDDAH